MTEFFTLEDVDIATEAAAVAQGPYKAIHDVMRRRLNQGLAGMERSTLSHDVEHTLCRVVRSLITANENQTINVVLCGRTSPEVKKKKKNQQINFFLHRTTTSAAAARR